MTLPATLSLIAVGVIAVLAVPLVIRLRAEFWETVVRRGGLRLGLLVLALLAAIKLWEPRASVWPWISAAGAVALVQIYVARRNRALRRERENRFNRMVSQGARGQGKAGEGELGPNERQVRAFLATLGQLSDDDWHHILRATEYRSLGSIPEVLTRRRSSILRTALDNAGRDPEKFQALQALSSALTITTPNEGSELTPGDRRYVAASPIVEALVLRDLLSPKQFESIYAPFERFIPLSGIVSPSRGTLEDPRS
jgi:hypothetical protein